MIALVAMPRELLQKLASAQPIIWALGKVACAAAVAFFYFGVKVFSDSADIVTPALDLSGDIAQEPQVSKAPLDKYSIITRRNIFGVMKKTSNASPPPENKTPPTELRLVGTHFSESGEKIAIIENVKKSEQDIFEENDDVFEEGTKLIEVGETNVKINQNGQVKVLELEEGSSASSDKSSDDSSGDAFTVSETELNTALSNLPELLSQARAVPYFRNGESIGMRLFAIRKGSLYEKLGLKNGDIVKAVNDNNIGDPTQALKLFEQLKNERKIRVVMERAGEEKTISYAID